MPEQYNGLPANIIPYLPTPKNISSSTNTSPIVVTTATPHLLTSGDYAIVHNHTVNTNANGIWPVVVVSSTQVQLVGTTGNGVGGATGTLLNLGFGTTYQLPSDGDAFNAAAWNVGLEALGDRTAQLRGDLHYSPTLKTGGLRTVEDGAVDQFNSGSQLILASGAIEQVDGTATWTSGSVMKTNTGSRIQYPGPQRPSDADATLSVASGPLVILAMPAAARTYKLQTTTGPVPLEGERFTLVYPSHVSVVTTFNLAIQREDGTALITLPVTDSWAVFQFEAGVWRGMYRSDNTAAVGAGW